MGHGETLSFGEFLRDIRLVVSSPGRRFPVIRARGARWGSLALLIIPTYIAFDFAGGIYFRRDPFPGYSFIPPLLAAVVAVILKLYLIHLFARLFRGKAQISPGQGRYSDLVVVFGYTGVPSILALLLGSGIFMLIPDEIGYVTHNFRAVGISIMVALGIALFIWKFILVVLALRTVYMMRDIKIVASFILGSALLIVPAIGMEWIGGDLLSRQLKESG